MTKAELKRRRHYMALSESPSDLAWEDVGHLISVGALVEDLPVDECCKAYAEISYADAAKLASWLLSRVIAAGDRFDDGPMQVKMAEDPHLCCPAWPNCAETPNACLIANPHCDESDRPGHKG